MEESISVIIPVRNEEKKINECLKSVFNQTIKPLEVIVVDGHSTDHTVNIAKKFPVKVLYEDYHTRAGACQIGVENAQGKYIAFTDADCIPKKEWLKNLVNEFHEDIIGVGGGIKNLGDDLWVKSINLALDTFLGSANSVQGKFFHNKRFVTHVSGCNSMYRKADILKIGGFDTELLTAEDLAINSKLVKFGKIIYTPYAIVCHNHNRGLINFSKRMYQYGYGRAKSRLWGLQIIPPVLAPLLLISLIFTLQIIFSIAVLYLIILGAMGLKFSIYEKKLNYLYSIPLVYIVEHVSYTLGFWKGII